MTSRRSFPMLIAAAVACGVAACGSTLRGEALAGPMSCEDPSVADGAKVFAYRRDKCHPGGETGLGPALNDKPLPKFLMRLQVRAGLGAMPSFDDDLISDDDLDDLLDDVVALRRHGR